MTGRELLSMLRRRGCVELRQKGPHVRVQCGKCMTTVSLQKGDIPEGTLDKIKRDLKDCLGEDWLP